MNAPLCGCGASWTGLNIAHCGACHETFSTVRHFDTHRSQVGEHGQCVDPGSLRRGRRGDDTGQPLLRRDKRGFWVSSDERPVELSN